jgi:N6-L-threonylcarbamoyladenine synthase
MSTQKPVRILGIETSCDETAIAILAVDPSGSRVQVKKHLVSSQIPIHQRYGGVVPEVAARSHVPETVSLLSQATGRLGLNAFDVIAVTRGPGLATALSVGLEAGRTLAFLSGKPIIGVNHLEGHLASAWLNAKNRKQWKFPLLALVVSGGHTELVLMKNFCKYKLLGQTRDDAAGEAFDKTAKLMGLPYPGGPQIARLAKLGNANAYDLPRPMMKDGSFDFSFSGLKTAVRLLWERENPPPALAPPPLTPPRSGGEFEQRKVDFAASLQQAIVDVLVEKTIAAGTKHRVQGILLVGGVSANEHLRTSLGLAIKERLPGVKYFPSDKKYITDNAAMIAAAGFWHVAKGKMDDWKKMVLDPEWNL